VQKVPSVLIVVLNWMKYEDTINCVRSLQLLDYSNFTIFIVDNASENESFQVLKEEFPTEIVLQSKENNGYAAGNKIGSDYALAHGFDLVWVLNNDCVVRKESLTHLVESYLKYGDALYSNTTLMSENPDIIHYAGTYAIDEPLQPDKYPTYDKWKGKLLDEVKDQLVDRPARIYGHSMLIPVSVIKKYGFMDTNYFMFCEETDYTLTLDQKGIPSRYSAKAIVTHISTSTFKLSPKMKFIGTYYGTRNHFHLDRKFPNGFREKIIKQHGGWKGIVKFVVLNRLLRRQYLEDEVHYRMLGIWHALIHKRGKVVMPEKLL
jgi:GT2 family glycosyltransferase